MNTLSVFASPRPRPPHPTQPSGQPHPKTNPLTDPKTNPHTDPKTNQQTNPKPQNIPNLNPSPSSCHPEGMGSNWFHGHTGRNYHMGS